MSGKSVGFVDLNFIIGKFRGSCILSVKVSNPNFDSDLHEMGAYIEDLLDCDLPKEEGIYQFTGETFFIDSMTDPEHYTTGNITKIRN